MADLYGTKTYSPPSSSDTSLPPEDFSTFLHHLLQNPSTTSMPPCMYGKRKVMQSFTPLCPAPLFSSASEPTCTAGLLDVKVSSEDQHRLKQLTASSHPEGGLSAVIDSISGVNFSDPAGYSVANVKEIRGNTFSSSRVADSDVKRRKVPAEADVDDGCDSESFSVPSRGSSKRSRAAEVHNLSEKRRRSKINEKMKALQNLIPNSNKTDKASMLDEAIEYLKQLQMQVQLLSMRNGLTLHPFYMPGVIAPMQLHQAGASFDEGHFSANRENSMPMAFNLSKHCTPSSQPIVIPTVENVNNSETSFGFDPSTEDHFLLMSSKESAGEDTVQELALDAGKNS